MINWSIKHNRDGKSIINISCSPSFSTTPSVFITKHPDSEQLGTESRPVAETHPPAPVSMEKTNANVFLVRVCMCSVWVCVWVEGCIAWNAGGELSGRFGLRLGRRGGGGTCRLWHHQRHHRRLGRAGPGRLPAAEVEFPSCCADRGWALARPALPPTSKPYGNKGLQAFV